MPFQLGVYRFGNTPLGPDGSPGTGEAIRNLIEAIRLAEAAGLDFFGAGEHHTRTISVACHGFVAEDADRAKETFFAHEMAAMAAHGRGGPGRSRLEASYGPGGMVFAGSPAEIASRLVEFHRVLGHSRQIIQMDLGHMPQGEVLRSIELLGTQVLPMVRDALA